MRFISRDISAVIAKAMKTFPAIVVTGPRQSGKTTLLKKLFSKSHKFVSLEDPDVRLRAQADPHGFLSQHANPVIIDEIQYVPELLSYIKTMIDENRQPGQWLLTGSQNFSLMEGISQSLAGRVAVLTLLPFSVRELKENIEANDGIASWLSNLQQLETKQTFKKSLSAPATILKGFYPELIANPNVDQQLWSGSYLNTYVERDIRNIQTVNDLRQFDRFVHLCASRTGQILNLSEMAKDIGISVPTAKRWISLLVTGYQVFLLPPYYRNIGKRLVKSPKLYFMDTGLCTYLMGIHQKDTLINGPTYGALFETMVVTDILKLFYNSGEKPSLYFLRTQDGLEIDLVIDYENKLHLFEIKSSMSIYPKHANPIKKVERDISLQIGVKSVISDAEKNFYIDKDVMNWNWEAALSE